MQYLARIYVTLKRTVNDPQGLTVRGALHSLGYSDVTSVRVGKYIELSVEAENEDAARSQVAEMCARLLANPVIEEFRFDLEPHGEPALR
jgi:phosphoribosylformylglycinamidine synthase